MNFQKLFRCPAVIHPIFISLFPLLAFYAHNIPEVSPALMVEPAAIIVPSVILVYVLLRHVLKSRYKAGMICSLCSIFFFSYGHVLLLFKDKLFPVLPAMNDYQIFPVWIILIGFFVIIILKMRKQSVKVMVYLNVFSFSVCIIPLITIGSFYLKPRSESTITYYYDSSETAGQTSRKPLLDYQPDIYYLIAERYPGQKSLSKYYGYDNQDFLSFLTEKGFYIASDSRANYLITYISIASSLTMDYLEPYLRGVNKDVMNRNPLIQLIQNNPVVSFLKARGYTFVLIGSNWIPTRENPRADVQYLYRDAVISAEFSDLFWQSTMAKPVLATFGIGSEPADRRNHRDLIFGQIGQLKQSIRLAGPKFVLAHLFLTHPPYIYDQNGKTITEQQEVDTDPKELETDMLTYANSVYKEVIRTILANSKRDPIIIIQGDEGPYFDRLAKNYYYFDLHGATRDELDQKSSILNAYHLPNVPPDILYPSITPVNSFRLIFNTYFGAKFPLLKDKIFGHQSFQLPMKQWEITGQLE